MDAFNLSLIEKLFQESRLLYIVAVAAAVVWVVRPIFRFFERFFQDLLADHKGFLSNKMQAQRTHFLEGTWAVELLQWFQAASRDVQKLFDWVYGQKAKKAEKANDTTPPRKPIPPSKTF